VAGLAGGLIAITAAYLSWQHVTSFVSTDDAYITGHVHQLGARVQGTVLSIAVQDNQHVQAGQLLVKLDPKDYQIAVATARAAADKAEIQARETQTSVATSQWTANANKLQAAYSAKNTDANISRAKAALQEAQSGVVTAQAQIDQRKAELNRAQEDYNRYALLVKEGAVTQQSFDQMTEAKSVAEANVLAAKANMDQARLRVLEAQQQLAQAQASIDQARSSAASADASVAQMETAQRDVPVQRAAAEQAEAEYQNAVTQLSYTDIVAPVSGRVGHRTVEIGQQVDRGQALLSIVSDEKWVVANFKETDLHGMRPGQSVEIKIDSIPNRSFTGRVDSLAPASGAQFTLLPPDNASGNFTKVVQRIPVKIVFDSESIKGYEDILEPGMSVEVSVRIRS
jgi:membrane fusion protein (multidrug efflux system)